MKKRSILIVEDERIVARDLQESLGEMGYDAYAIAASSDSALASASERCPDVVLMDIRIKGACDGIECARLLQSQFDVPVVFLTAHADAATLARATEVNPHGYLLKPVKDGELRAAVEIAAHRHAMNKRLRDHSGRATDPNEADNRAELADRLESLSTMAGGVAHEINNPLAVLVSNLDYALVRVADLRAAMGSTLTDDAGAMLDEIVDTLRENEVASGRITRIVRDLRVFCEPPPAPDTRSDVARAVEWALRATQQELRARACVTADVADVPAVTVDPTRLRQIVVNLLLNAARAIRPGRPTEEVVALSVGTTADEKQVVIEIRDSGEGMSPEVQRRIFEPFFTTRDVGEGKGLGLAVCHGIVRAAGGEMQVESILGKGSVFRVFLPVAPKSPAAPFSHVPATTRGRILVVDDEPALLRAVQRTLRAHDTVVAESVDDALRAIEHERSFDIIISDVVMPERDGLDFYESLLARFPELAARVVFLTGGALSSKQHAFFATIPNLCLTKPFDAASLIRIVSEQLAAVR